MSCSANDLSKSHASMNSSGIVILTSSTITDFFDDSSPSAKSVQKGRFRRWPEYYIPEFRTFRHIGGQVGFVASHQKEQSLRRVQFSITRRQSGEREQKKAEDNSRKSALRYAVSRIRKSLSPSYHVSIITTAAP